MELAKVLSIKAQGWINYYEFCSRNLGLRLWYAVREVDGFRAF
jgi:hypothetical protein